MKMKKRNPVNLDVRLSKNLNFKSCNSSFSLIFFHFSCVSLPKSPLHSSNVHLHSSNSFPNKKKTLYFYILNFSKIQTPQNLNPSAICSLLPKYFLHSNEEFDMERKVPANPFEKSPNLKGKNVNLLILPLKRPHFTYRNILKLWVECLLLH